MVQSAAFLMKAYSIPMKMLLNADETDIHFVLTSGAQIWAKRGSKHVLVHGMKDKRQVTVSVSSSANDNPLHFQVVFTNMMDKGLPHQNTSCFTIRMS